MGFILDFKLKFHNICCPKNVFPLVINFMLGITVNALGLIGYIRGVISYNSEPSNYSLRHAVMIMNHILQYLTGLHSGTNLWALDHWEITVQIY